MRPAAQIVAFAVALFGGVTASFPPPAAATDKTLTIGMGFLSSNRGNPYQGITLPAVLPHHAVYDTLTTLDADGNVGPSLAVSWHPETPDDPRVWIFELRPGVKFSNDEPLTAGALVVSADHMKTTKGRSQTIGSQMYMVTGAEAVDDLTVRVTLSEADILFPLHATSWRIPAPKAFSTTPDEEFAENPVGTGPFVVESWSPGRVTMRANPESWRPPKLDRLDVLEIPDDVARLQAFVSGATDFVMGLAPDNRETVESVGGEFVTRKTLMAHFLAFNTTRETPLADPRVRHALNLAVDRDRIISAVLDNSTVPASQFSIPGTFGYNTDLAPEKRDVEKAKQMLADAGYPNGMKLLGGVTSGLRPSDTAYLQQIASDLREVGVELELLSRPQMKQQKDMFDGTLDVDVFVMFTRGTDAITDYRHRSCVGLTQGRSAFHCDAAIGEVVKQAMAEHELERRAALYKKVAAMERESPPGILLWQGVEFDALAEGITGYRPAYDLLHLDEIDIE